MSFFESLIALLLAAVILLQVARRLNLPYPAMLALAGVLVAFIPGAPTIRMEAQTALALFLAPVLLDAAFDYPLGAAGRLWRPLIIMVVGAVLVTTAVVAWIGWAVAGLPIAAAVVLGAIVAPPDAVAATAITSTVTLPRRTVAVLKGESLLNDATALLLFSGALAVQSAGGIDGHLGLQLGLAVPGGVLFGIGCGWLLDRINGFVTGTLGGSLLQFISAFAVWVAAEHLHLSAVLAVVACAMTIARREETHTSPRMRVHSFAVWATVVFLLNVLAFLLMGMQARTIIGRLASDHLGTDLRFVGLVILGIVAARFAVVMVWNFVSRRSATVRGSLEPPTIGQGVVVAWSGMRGVVTLATAFALPQNFPQRDLVALTAFAVVLATLVIQGMTLAPLIRWLKLDQLDDPAAEIADARRALNEAALARLDRGDLPDDGDLRTTLEAKQTKRDHPDRAAWLKGRRNAGLAVLAAQRERLEALLRGGTLSMENFYKLQEELDWRALTLLPEDERQIEEA